MSDTTPTRPLPRTDEPDTAEFWRKTKDQVLGYQHCDDCGTIVFYPRRHCTGCLGSNLTWQASAGEGSIYSFSIIRQSYHPFFRAQVPFAVAWVDLDEGPRLLTNITGDPSTLEIGQRVRVVWEEHEALNIPLFEPIQRPG
jgi:uncharacterized OB-fold protein